MTACYNEIDPYAAQWLRNLIAGGHIASGDVDERSILDVRALGNAIVPQVAAEFIMSAVSFSSTHGNGPAVKFREAAE